MSPAEEVEVERMLDSIEAKVAQVSASLDELMGMAEALKGIAQRKATA